MEFITTILILIVIALLFNVSSRDQKIAKLIDKLPGPKKYPLIGTVNLLDNKRENLFDFFLKQSCEYGPIYRTWMGKAPLVHLSKAEYIEKILSTNENLSKNIMYDNIKPWLHDGLLTSSGGPLYRRNRKLILPTFHLEVLESFVEVFNERMAEFIEKISIQTNKQFDLYPLLANYALDVICETAMGVQINAMAENSNEYIKAVNQIGELATLRFFNPLYKFNFIYNRTKQGKEFLKSLKIVHDFTNKIVAERKNSIIATDKKRKLAFLDLLIETSKEWGLTDSEIRQEVDTFMVAGYETLSTTVCWCLFLLGNYPEVQAKVREEVSGLFPDNNKLTIKELNEMKYLERVVKETLRLYPSAPTLGRILSEDILIDEYTIPAGTSVAIHLYRLHRDAGQFREPNKFDPDRFLPENCRTRHPYAYVPFSAGPRSCIGQKFALYEVKTIIAWIIRNYRLKAMENRENVKMYKEIVLRPQNGLQVILERIS